MNVITRPHPGNPMKDIETCKTLVRFSTRRQKHPIATPCFSTAAAAARRPRRILGARGRTPLHCAAEEGHAAVVEQLISAGAKVNAAKNDGRGPGRVFGSFWEWL